MENTLVNKIQLKWTKLNRLALEKVANDQYGLVKMIQEAYGYSRAHAEREYHDFQITLRPVRNRPLAR